MTEHEFEIPGGPTWVVQAFSFPSSEEAKAVWEKIKDESKGTEGNFSIWRTTNPEQTIYLVITCASREYLPEVEGGTPYELDHENALAFATRRARTGVDAMAAGETEHVSQEMRYGDKPVVIDRASGSVRPYRRR